MSGDFKMNMKAIRVGLFCCSLAIATPAMAAKCNVQSNGVAFGAYDSLSPTHQDGTGNVRITCNSTTAFTVGLGSGAGTFDQRSMTNEQSTLRYNLYTDATRTLIWGDGSLNGVSGIGTSVDLTVYGRIPARQSIPAGAYIDAITVTVFY